MKKKQDCIHQLDEEPCCQPALLNQYECDDCGAVWLDTWSCGRDDECPNCRTDISPSYSEEVATCACAYLGK
jgi:hypothetical protein